MIFYKISFGLLFLVLIGCNSTKNSGTNEPMKNEALKKEIAQKMLAAGFTKGTIVASNIPGDCPFTIRVETETGYLLDPVNLEESFKKDGEKIWVKYVGMRMMNRCDKAAPITISEIQVRE